MAEILHQLRLVVFPIIYRVSYLPGGARFQPSTVSFFFGVELKNRMKFDQMKFVKQKIVEGERVESEGLEK